MVEVIILAGGKSSRFKKNKMETLLLGTPVLQRTIETFQNITDKITIVTGHYDVSYIKEFIDKNNINVIHNDDHEKGMFSSVLKGVKQIDSDIFLTPGDYPNIKQSTIQILLKEDGLLRVPTYKGRKGHPIFIKKELVKELKKEHIDSNLKVFRDRHPVNYIEVTDEGVLQDIDVYEDLQHLEERYG